ncbi:DUF5060 domain-containing protein [Algibacillus agarilyticus]|uniref:DUF5060 domain-containing protein n=1 Tax=Algibacillus agarilyticus TaxID=2234133 RepID=UPI000DCF7C14|nr:DUF5060 domain-containing protein [Algibacillus agarilyticus]
MTQLKSLFSAIKFSTSLCLFLLGCNENNQSSTQGIPAIQYKTISLDFDGPNTNENDKINPFTQYRLVGEFIQGNETRLVRGFYNADGNAGETSATSGSQWRINFKPFTAGTWQYKIHFDQGDNIALTNDLTLGKPVSFDGQSGQIVVEKRQPPKHDVLSVKNGYLYQRHSQQGVLKVGANSPENLLGYIDFDSTYRAGIEKQDKVDIGKASTDVLHKYPNHLKDWTPKDPSWQQGKGKSLIGAINYLASTEMNAIYFLTMNIAGDGKDVWPYINHHTLDRFDVSKLAQWETVFQHMEDKHMIMHVILQETENELLLDNGDTGFQRQLYLQEMIARFSHHAGIIWNIGEENGPVHFSPTGQTPQQVMSMTEFLKQNDPYQHPIFIHTHASAKHKDETLTPLMGYKHLDGLSFQVDQPLQTAQHIAKWQNKALAAGHQLAITMDEIGLWHTGALPDSDDPNHDIMRQQVMWPSFMLNAAGVEWYFGYKFAHNDLNAEDWRSRDLLWQQTAIAKNFFTQQNVFELRQTCGQPLTTQLYCVTNKQTDHAIVYLTQVNTKNVVLPKLEGQYNAKWFNPKTGTENLISSLIVIKRNQAFTLPALPTLHTENKVENKTEKQSDWALVLTKKS